MGELMLTLRPEMSEQQRGVAGRRAARVASSVAIAAVMVVAIPACGNDSRSRSNDRWVTTQDTTVDIDWDAVGKAYREAEGPEDFEKKVNEIYTGDEIISIAVQDIDDKTQEVTGFFDKNTDGKVEEPEKIFSLKREITGDKEAQYRIHGHGAYHGYTSPMWNIASGMVLGYMVSRAFSPGYRPVYTQPYMTSPDRHKALTTHRDGYRQKNPDKFRQGKSSKSGRSYGSKGSNYGGGKPSSSSPSPRPRSRSLGGGRFGRKGRPSGRVIRLES